MLVEVWLAGLWVLGVWAWGLVVGWSLGNRPSDRRKADTWVGLLLWGAFAYLIGFAFVYMVSGELASNARYEGAWCGATAANEQPGLDRLALDAVVQRCMERR